MNWKNTIHWISYHFFLANLEYHLYTNSYIYLEVWVWMFLPFILYSIICYNGKYSSELVEVIQPQKSFRFSCILLVTKKTPINPPRFNNRIHGLHLSMGGRGTKEFVTTNKKNSVLSLAVLLMFSESITFS